MTIDLQFIGKNIRYLRRERGQTIAHLASEVGTSDVVLGRIERGVNAPSASILYRLAKALNTSFDTLFAEETEVLREYRFSEEKKPFIVTAGQGKSLTPKIKSMAWDIIEGFQALEDICGAQKQAKIPLLIPFSPDSQGMERLSETVRRFMGIEYGIVFDYFELFENQGLRVIVTPLPKELDSFSFYDPSNQNAFFFINTKKNQERQLFRLAYELGLVLILTTQIQTHEKIFPDEHETGSASNKPLTADRAARRFAATFLMPAKAVCDTVSQLGINQDRWSYKLLLRIKHRFGISAESFLYRLIELELINSELALSLKEQIFHYYAAANYREPDSSRRILTPNGRLGDLILTGRQVAESCTEVSEIGKMLIGWRVPFP